VKIFFFTKYTRAGASSRYRSYQYFPALEAAGLRVTVLPLFDDAYLAHKYARGHARVVDVLLAFARRLWGVFTVPRCSVVVIEYELLPWVPALLERWLAWRGCRMVVDYDDAIFHQYDSHSNLWVRRLLRKKIATVMRLAYTVVAGNAYLADYARRVGARWVEVIPTVIDLARYAASGTTDAPSSSAAVFTIGWIGSPSTTRYLKNIALALAEACRNGQARVRLIGSGQIELPGVPVEVVQWREGTEVDEIRGLDVGIMPLKDEPWARGKCGFKLIQYMACGLPVVASPIGANCEIVATGNNGYLASTTNEWVSALENLRANVELRRRMGEAGRRRVEERYCLEVTAPRWTALLQSVHSKPHSAQKT
jgi:glycosyltransferase involved in cell wall biosynthesis